jgi:hypothetical protein
MVGRAARAPPGDPLARPLIRDLSVPLARLAGDDRDPAQSLTRPRDRLDAVHERGQLLEQDSSLVDHLDGGLDVDGLFDGVGSCR